MSVSLSVASNINKRSTLSQTFSVSRITQITSLNRACRVSTPARVCPHSVMQYNLLWSSQSVDLWIGWERQHRRMSYVVRELFNKLLIHHWMEGFVVCVVGKMAQDVYRDGMKVLWCHSHLVLNMYRVTSPSFHFICKHMWQSRVEIDRRLFRRILSIALLRAKRHTTELPLRVGLKRAS